MVMGTGPKVQPLRMTLAVGSPCVALEGYRGPTLACESESGRPMAAVPLGDIESI